ncbi:hypothetical protein ACJX0J_035873 [Zea mays]
MFVGFIWFKGDIYTDLKRDQKVPDPSGLTIDYSICDKIKGDAKGERCINHRTACQYNKKKELRLQLLGAEVQQRHLSEKKKRICYINMIVSIFLQMVQILQVYIEKNSLQE